MGFIAFWTFDLVRKIMQNNIMSSYHMLFVSLCKAYGLHSLLDFGNKLSMYKYLYVTECSENTPGRVDSGRVDPGLS